MRPFIEAGRRRPISVFVRDLITLFFSQQYTVLFPSLLLPAIDAAGCKHLHGTQKMNCPSATNHVASDAKSLDNRELPAASHKGKNGTHEPECKHALGKKRPNSV